MDELVNCDNCGATAVYSIDEGDGNYCSYACETCAAEAEAGAQDDADCWQVFQKHQEKEKAR